VDSVREVVETVVFVVVLVLMLKSFAAEAFVIPTGSMAETLYGYQKMVTCPACRTEFPVNCSNEVEPQPGGGTSYVDRCSCPNCQLPIHFRRQPVAEVTLYGDNLTPVYIVDPGPNSGDRVLVAKFLYDLVNREPDRLNVVVFKFPGNSGPDGSLPPFPFSGPQKQYVPMNYIKRLVGRSDEVILIRAGKVYSLPPEHQPAALRKRAAEDHDHNKVDPLDLWQWKYMYENDPAWKADLDRAFQAGDQFQIIRKKPDILLAMARLVYDSNHPAEDLERLYTEKQIDRRRWRPAAKTAGRTTASTASPWRPAAPASSGCATTTCCAATRGGGSSSPT